MRDGKYGFGIIGLGMIADFHAKAIGELSDGCLVAAYDMIPEKVFAFCSGKEGVNPYTDLEEFLSDPDLDIVTVTTPSGAHLDVALAAVNAGKHVIVEKPIEVTTERIDILIKAAKEKGVLISGIFQSRFFEAPQLIMKAIREGRFGRLTLCDAQVKWYRTQEYYDSVGWRGTWKLDGGGALMNQSIHAIDLLQWFCGPVSEVSAFTALLGHENIEVEDTAAAVLKFRNGAIGVIEGSTSVYPGFLKKLEICGTKGSVILEEESLKAWNFEDERPEDEEIRTRFLDNTETGGGASDPKAIGYIGHKHCFENFLNALENGTEPLITGEEARKSVEIITAIYESARTGKPVSL